jgi:hypothetical protein
LINGKYNYLHHYPKLSKESKNRNKTIYEMINLGTPATDGVGVHTALATTKPDTKTAKHILKTNKNNLRFCDIRFQINKRPVIIYYNDYSLMKSP